jgi:hypothetical protein
MENFFRHKEIKMAQSVMLKKEEKSISIINMMLDRSDVNEFVNLFIKNYPSDWQRINERWNKHEIANKGKKHPMPKPEQYLINLYNNYKNGQT